MRVKGEALWLQYMRAAPLFVLSACGNGSRTDSGPMTPTTPPAVASVEVGSPADSIYAGESVQLTVTLRDAQGNTLTGRVVTWSSSDLTIASVTTNGLVTGLAIGLAEITATSEGIAGRKDVVVARRRIAYVLNRDSDDLSVIDISRDTIVGSTIGVGRQPLGMAVTPDGARVYVSNTSDGNVTVIDAATGAVVGSPIPIGTSPRGIVISPDGTRAYVAAARDRNISVVDIAAHSVITVIPVQLDPFALAITPDGGRIYVTGAAFSVEVIDVHSNAVIASIGLPSLTPGGWVPGNISPAAVTPDGSRLYLTNRFGGVGQIDVQSNTVSEEFIFMEGSPNSLAITPDGTRVVVTNESNVLGGDGDVRVIDVATNTVLGDPIPVGRRPEGVAITPDGRKAYVANIASGDVTVIDLSASAVLGNPIPVGAWPVLVAIVPSDGQSDSFSRR